MAGAGGVDLLAEQLVAAVGAAHVLTDPDVMAGFERDWTGRWQGRARLVVRPGTTAEVAQVVQICAAVGVAIVPQGGNTGLVGGAVPDAGAVILHLGRLDHLDPVDLTSAQVTAGAGVTLARLQDHVGAAGLAFPVDLAARDSATVGGMVATNAGGLHVLRYGGMRSQVVGVEAVMANGGIVRRLDGLIKDNTGYDLPGLLCGSEGTLAVVTAARLRLSPLFAHRVTALIGLEGLPAALDLVARLRTLTSLEAAEVMFASGIDIVCAHTGLPAPFPVRYPCVLLVECAAATDPVDDLAAALLAAPEPLDTAVATAGAARAGLWSWRERHTEAVNAIGVPHKLDVTLPLGSMAAFESEVRPLIEKVAPGATTVIFGHVGDGNLHVNVVGPAPDDDGVDDAVFRLVAAHHGSISAEHGIGRAKRGWLDLTRSADDIAAMAAIKMAFDPGGLFNPGVLLP
jgi:FAD/FMN-containing dehydrogenase